METSFLTINGDRVAIYTNSSDSNNVIFFLHGNSLNSSTYIKQFESSELKNIKLVAIDFPGHGKSDKPTTQNETYSVPGLINVVKSVVNQLGLKSIILVGHSFGGHIAIETTEKLENLKGLFIFGTPPIALPPQLDKMYLPHESFNYAFKGDLSDNEINALASSYTKSENNFSQYIKETDPNARESIGAAIGTGNYKDEPVICSKLKYPIAIAHGEKDPLVNLKYFNDLDFPTLWNNKVNLIDDSGHSPQYEKSNEFNKLLNEFSNFCFNGKKK